MSSDNLDDGNNYFGKLISQGTINMLENFFSQGTMNMLENCLMSDYSSITLC